MNDFKDIHEQMMIHGMKLPSNRVNIQIPNAEMTLVEYFKYFLSVENKEFIWQPEYKHVAEWLEDNNNRGLLLYGDCGRGKSILSRFIIPAILLRFARKVVSVYDVQEMNMNLDTVLKKNIISLDDIGTEEVLVKYGNKRLAFAEIMDLAEKQGKLIIISTNLNGNGIVERYGQRVMERIISTTKRVEFNGKSLRS